MAGEKQVSEKKYPPEVNYSMVLKGLARASLGLDLVFHLLMAILLITGLIIDLLGPWLSGWLFGIRSVAHGYVGALFIFVFAVYLVYIAYSKKMRMVFTGTNYVDFLFYILLIITGMTLASANRPWIDIVVQLSDALSVISPFAPALHVLLTYVWILFSLTFPGGILHGFASVYLISRLRKKSKTKRLRMR